MNKEWNLDPLYHGFDDPAYQEDLSAMKQLVADVTEFASQLPTMDPT